MITAVIKLMVVRGGGRQCELEVKFMNVCHAHDTGKTLHERQP
jgi:hypothetical protein